MHIRLALSIGSLLIACIMGAANAQVVGGTYAVTGTNPDGSTYKGTAEISLKESHCRIAWHIGPSTAQGVCIVSSKAVAAFYKLGPAFGLVVYEVGPDGSLKGYWTIVDKDGIGGEILTPKQRL